MHRRLAILAVLAGCLLGATPALALDMPARKPGLWQLTMSFEGRNIPAQSMKQCIDAASDRLMSANYGGSPQQSCDKQTVSRAGAGIVADSVCHFGGATTTSHAVISGDFNSAYTMQVTSKRQGPALPGMPAGGESHMSIAAKWLGPCAPGQRPGDVIMANGMKMNVLEMQKLRGIPRRPQR
jgi:Protein of unknown function (DUF3617)